jgi:hypothetical protein
MFHKMLAPHSTAKRKTCADGALDNFDFNVGVFDCPILPHKRARVVDQHHYSAKEWSWSSASPYFPCLPPTSFPVYLNPVEGHVDEERTRGFFPTATAGTAFGDMPAKRRRPRQSSDAENGRMSDLEGPHSAQLSSSRSNKNDHGTSSRRLPFPGENPPRLAATWHETTSSRGAENTFMAGVQGPPNYVTSSPPNFSSGIMTDGVESRSGLNITDNGSASVLEFNVFEEQQNADSFLNDFLNFEPDSGNSGNCDVFESHQQFDSWPEGAVDGFGCISDNTQNPFSFQIPANDFSGDPLLGDLFSPSIFLDTIRAAEDIQGSRIPGSEVGGSVEREHIDIETEETQCKRVSISSNSSMRYEAAKLSRPEINHRSSMGPPLQTLPYADAPDVLEMSLSIVPTEVWDGPPLTCEPQRSQARVSTPSISWPESYLDRRGKKTHDNTSVESKLDLRKPAYASRALQSVEAMETDPNSWTQSTEQVEQRSEISSDSCSNGLRIDGPDWTKGIPGLERLNENRFNQHLSLRMHDRPEIPAERKPHAVPHFSTKVSNLSNGRTAFVVVEDTNETQPEVQEFLARANQPSKPRKGRRSSDSPSGKVETTWEHTILPTTHFTEAGKETLPQDTSQKLGRRTRPLKTDTRAKAKEMRKIRSCLRCKVAKIAVS